MANLYCGALIDMLCGTRAMFKSYLAADIDKVCRAMYNDVAGTACYCNVSDIPFEDVHSPMVLVITPPCPDYSSSNPNPMGELGDKGGAEFTKIPVVVKALKPMCVFIEEVGNLIQFEDELVTVLLGLQNSCNMVVHSALVSMQQYGDIENSWRLPIVAWHEGLGLWAHNYRIPVGAFSDAVSYCAEDVATRTAEIPVRFRRFMSDYSVQCGTNLPGMLQKVAQSAPGHGPSWAPHACYNLKGIPPKSTTYGAGRHKPKGWRQGDPGNVSYMFTPAEVVKHKNLSVTVMEFYEKHYAADKTGLKEEMSLEAFLYRCLGNGFTMKFGEAFFESLHKTLQLAGVPFDIVNTVVSDDGARVHHVFAEDWSEQVKVCVAEEAAALSAKVQKMQHEEQQCTAVYSMVLDTGATAMLAWDDQDSFLTEARPANATIVGAKAGSEFAATSRGKLLMACFLAREPNELGSSHGLKRDMEFISDTQTQMFMREAQLIEPLVITAPKALLRKQLAGFPYMFVEMKLNLDIRQWRDGRSCMWKFDEKFPQDESRRWEIPIRWDAVTKEWVFEYVPINKDSIAHRTLRDRRHRDLQKSRGALSHAEEMGMQLTVEQAGAFLVDLTNTDMAKQLKHVDLPKDFDDFVKTLPDDKRVEVVFARHPDDRQVRGVKQSLPKKSKRNMTEAEFHEWYGHMGSGKNCALCHLVRGCMRFIYKVVDKYVETRMGYFFDMDTLTMSHRAYCGTKYYTGLRDRGSKAIKAFPLVFRDDLIAQFDRWLTAKRADPIYQVYNWRFCQVVRADNDGVWMRKSKKWLDLCEKHQFRMFYTDKQRKETNSHAESLMGIMEVTGKSCMWQRALPPGDHVDSFMAAVWLLNRFPPMAALARDPPDGDVARPLEMLTYGWYSRTQINSELCRFVLPGTLVLAHMSEVRGSDVGKTKSDLMVAKGMLGKQLIVYYPNTRRERKIDSYTVIESKGVHWRDQMGIEYVAPTACKPLPGDLDADSQARKSKQFTDLVMPKVLRDKLKGIRMAKNVDAVRHIQDKGVQIVRPPDIQQLIRQLRELKLENARLQADELVDGSESAQVESVSEDHPEYTVVEHAAPGLGSGMMKKADVPAPPADTSGEVSSDRVQQLIESEASITVQQDNPKKAGSKSFLRYERYKAATTLKEMLALGGSKADIRFDMERGFITVSAESESAAALKTGDSNALQTDVRLKGMEEPSEWQLAMKGQRYVTSKQLSFTRLCAEMHIPAEMQGVFHKWLREVSNGVLTLDDIGKLNTKGSKCKVGLEVPNPTGPTWTKMLSGHNKKRGSQSEAPTQGVMQAEIIGCMLARALDAWDRNEDEVVAAFAASELLIEAYKTKVRAKDNVEGIVAPPKGVTGLYKMKDAKRRQQFIQSMVKEISALTEMGTISHMHSAEELLDRFGIDIEATPAVPTLMVFENKFSDGKISAEEAAAKARMCVEGTKRNMTKGVHFDSVYAATPGHDSIMLFNAVVVYLRLQRRCFDVGNAYAWASQETKLALMYPRGMDQRNALGQRLYMCLHRNTYGKPDGANLWYKERDGFWLSYFNDAEVNPGWQCRQLVMEQTWFVFTYTAPQGDRVIVTHMLTWSDDCDLASDSDPHMQFIQDASHNRWKVKEVSSDFMLGVRRTLSTDNGVWVLKLTQEDYIDGVVGAYREHIEAAGWARTSPETPVPPGEWLSLADEVPEEEAKEVLEKGYRAVCGSLIWVSRFTHKEISEGISVACRVMSKPSHKAWRHCMQMVAWLRDHRTRGVQFRSDYNEHGLVAACDASFNPDKKDSKCQHSNVVLFCGPISMTSSKLTHGWGSPANEYMAIRWAAAKVRKFRNIFEELSLTEVIAQPTKIYVDNDVAIHWVKTGKITDGNNYLDLAYHQPREWEREESIIIQGVHTKDNFSDLGTKPCGPDEYDRFLMVVCGYEVWKIKYPRTTISFT